MSKTVWDWGVKSAENLVDILKNNIVTGSLVMLKIYKGLSAVIWKANTGMLFFL